MKTMGEIAADARRMAYGSMSEQINLLAADFPADGVELELELSVTGITPGMILSSGLNVWWVKEVSSSANIVYVVPRYDGSFAERLPAGSVVYIKPRVTDWHLFNEINNVISQMSSPTYGLYKIGEFTAVGSHHWDTIPVPDSVKDISEILAVSALEFQGSNRWYDLPTRTYRWMPDQRSIKILRDVRPNNSIKVTYKAPFSKANSLVDDVESMCGLAASMTDIPALGAAAALLRTTESRRNQVQVQGDPRRADEVQAGANSGAARDMQRQFQMRVNDEYIRLVQRNPIFMGV
jgi:hypothetical protein